MARKKRFAPNDNNLAIAYYRFSSHSQNDGRKNDFAEACRADSDYGTVRVFRTG